MSGIQSSQNTAKTEGTQKRDSLHATFKKSRTWGALLLMVIFAVYLWRVEGSNVQTSAPVESGKAVTSAPSLFKGGSLSSPERLALPDGQIIKVDLRRKEERDPMLVRINITDTVRIQGKVVERSPGRPIGDGKTAYGFCAEIVEPAWLKKSPDAPKQHLMFPNPRHIGLSHDMKPTDEMRKFLVQNEVTSVTVSVYSILTVVGIQGKC